MIGISMRIMEIAYSSGSIESRDCIASDWWHFLACALPDEIILPLPNAPAETGNILAKVPFAGFILSGGDDWGVFPQRDETEQCILKYAELKALPVLGVCRGAQVINLLCGGKVAGGFSNAHIAVRHAAHAAFQDNGFYNIPLSIEVNSFHASGISAEGLAPGLEPLAYAEDGSIEAFASRDGRVCGLMWHPERENTPACHDILIFNQCFRRV